jgi:hypothetical protein
MDRAGRGQVVRSNKRNVICRFVDNLTSHRAAGPTPFLLLPAALEVADRLEEVGRRGGGEGRGAA